MTHTDEDPAAALEMVQLTRARTAGLVRAPVWYHPALGAIIAAIVASMEMREISGGIIAAGVAGMALLAREYQKRTGMWPNGLTAGGLRTRRLMMVALVVMVGLAIGGVRLKHGYGVDGALIVAGILIGLFATWYGFAWERAFRRDAGVERMGVKQ